MRKVLPTFAAMAFDGPVSGPAERRKGRASPMKSEEARVGKRVRVREDHRKANLRGLRGTIVERWGNPNHVALDVLLDEGGWQLFWYHELEEVEEGP